MWRQRITALAAGVAAIGTAGTFAMAAANATTAPSWTKQATEPQALTANGPALAVFDGRLYAAWTGLTTNKVFYASFNGKKWTKQATEPQASSANGPALTVFDGRLYAAWSGRTTNKVFYADYNI